VVEQRTIVEARKNPMGLAAFAITHPIEFASFMLDRSGPFKSWLANIMNQNQKALPAALGATAGAVEPQINRPPKQPQPQPQAQ